MQSKGSNRRRNSNYIIIDPNTSPKRATTNRKQSETVWWSRFGEWGDLWRTHSLFLRFFHILDLCRLDFACNRVLVV